MVLLFRISSKGIHLLVNTLLFLVDGYYKSFLAILAVLVVSYF